MLRRLRNTFRSKTETPRTNTGAQQKLVIVFCATNNRPPGTRQVINRFFPGQNVRVLHTGIGFKQSSRTGGVVQLPPNALNGIVRLPNHMGTNANFRLQMNALYNKKGINRNKKADMVIFEHCPHLGYNVNTYNRMMNTVRNYCKKNTLVVGHHGAITYSVHPNTPPTSRVQNINVAPGIRFWPNKSNANMNVGRFRA